MALEAMAHVRILKNGEESVHTKVLKNQLIFPRNQRTSMKHGTPTPLKQHKDHQPSHIANKSTPFKPFFPPQVLRSATRDQLLLQTNCLSNALVVWWWMGWFSYIVFGGWLVGCLLFVLKIVNRFGRCFSVEAWELGRWS